MPSQGNGGRKPWGQGPSGDPSPNLEELLRRGQDRFKQAIPGIRSKRSTRFLKVYEEYKKAPEVTRKRMYLETMERVLGGADKIIIDSKGGQGVVPYLSLDQLQRRKEEGKSSPRRLSD